MKILLLAMPDAAHNFHRIIRVPNLGLCSLAACLPEHEVRVVDLVLVHNGIGPWLRRCLETFRPDLIGISCMSFQYDSALTTMGLCRRFAPRAAIVLGGYHPTLTAEQLTATGDAPFDFLVRGEGERTLAGLVRALEQGGEPDDVPGLSWRHGGGFVHNPAGRLLDLADLPLPARGTRMLTGFSYFGKRLDCVETSRGCTASCTFCSITGMYGSSFRCHRLERVIADLEDLQRNGTECVLLVDDNITLDPNRFMTLAETIETRGLNRMEYLVQASVAGITADPRLIPALARANFRLVFLGIESINRDTLASFRKGDIRERTVDAVARLRAHHIAVMGGFIVGNPDDTAQEVRRVFAAARSMGIDLPVVQCVTPYPATRIRRELLEADMVVNRDDLSRYTGFICNVRTRHLTRGQLNRLMNWENLKLFCSPSLYRGNCFVTQRQRGAQQLLLNSLDYISGWFTGNQFRSRHSF